MFDVTPEVIKTLVRAGSSDPKESVVAMTELAKGFELPLRKGLMGGDILDGVFLPIELQPGAIPEFPLDFLAPGTEKDFVAYTLPGHGRVPERHVEGDFVMVPTFPIGNAIDWLLKYARDARWDIVGRAMEVLEAGFVKKMNDDGWHTLLSAGVDRNILVFDGDANPGQFTKRLVSLLKVIMRRNGGGNSTSVNRGKLTDLFLSPESVEDVRNWGIDLLDEFSRREMFLEDNINRLFNVNLHDIDELGESQEYQTFYTGTLGGAFASGDVELFVGLDLMHQDSFVMPVRAQIQIFQDELLHRQQRNGLYGWGEFGYACLDSRRVVLGSC